MIREERGRAVLHCDRCEARMDLMPWARLDAMREGGRLRLPTGWVALDAVRHQCPLHELRVDITTD